MCKEGGKEGAEKREEMGLNLQRNVTCRAQEEERRGVNIRHFLLLTCNVPPSLVIKVQEGTSSDIAFR